MQSKKEEKRALRAIYKEKRAQIKKGQKELLDSMLCQRVTALECFDRADIILTFSPSFLEPDIDPIAIEALRRGKKVAYPICDKATHTMTFRFVSSLDELCVGSYSIPEPPATNTAYSAEDNAICILPALTLSRDGTRLGYGGGYYDRFLENFRGISIGIAYDDFICDSLPSEPFDKKASIIISERGIIITDE